MKWFKKDKKEIKQPYKYQEKEILHLFDVDWKQEIEDVVKEMNENNYVLEHTLRLTYPYREYKNRIGVHATILIFKDLMQ